MFNLYLMICKDHEDLYRSGELDHGDPTHIKWLQQTKEF